MLLHGLSNWLQHDSLCNTMFCFLIISNRRGHWLPWACIDLEDFKKLCVQILLLNSIPELGTSAGHSGNLSIKKELLIWQRKYCMHQHSHITDNIVSDVITATRVFKDNTWRIILLYIISGWHHITNQNFLSTTFHRGSRWI